MSAKLRKGMILCAGMGTRLLPVTEKTPKPLVPILNLHNLLHNLYLMKELGIEEVILNLHHLGEQIEAVLGDGSHLGLKMHYSHEPVLLGTGGGVKKAESFFGKETFLLMNCDFVTNIDVAPLIAKHFERKALATMVLLDDKMRERAYSPVGVNENGELCSLPKLRTAPPTRTGIFTGIHILNPTTLAVLKEEPCGINEILYPHYMKSDPHSVFAEFAGEGYWHDTGNLPFVWATSMALLGELSRSNQGILARCLKAYGQLEEAKPGVWVKRGTPLPKAKIEAPAVIGANCTIASNSVIGPNAVIGDGSHVGNASHVTRSVLLGAAIVKENERLEREVRYGTQVLPLSE